MSRTIRRINERTRQWLLAPDINPRTSEPYLKSAKHIRWKARFLRGNDGAGGTDQSMTATVDREGGFKIQRWCNAPNKHWGNVSRMRRIAGKRDIIRGYNDHLDVIEDEGIIFDYRGYEIDSHDYEMDDYYHQCILNEYYDDLAAMDDLESAQDDEPYYFDDYYDEDYWYA